MYNNTVFAAGQQKILCLKTQKTQLHTVRPHKPEGGARTRIREKKNTKNTVNTKKSFEIFGY